MINILDDLPESKEINAATVQLSEALLLVRKSDFPAAKSHLENFIVTIRPLGLGLEGVLSIVQTVIEQCEGISVPPQLGVPFDSSSSSSSSSSSAPSLSPLDAGLQGKGEGAMTDGVSPGEMVAQLSAKGLQCQIEFSRYETLPETVLGLGSKALIELVGDGPVHWVLKFTTEEKVLLIWPGEVPHETLVSAERVGIVVVFVHQNPEECAAAVLNYLAVLEKASPASSTNGQLLIELNEQATSKVTEAAETSVETCVAVSNSFFDMIVNEVSKFDPRSFVQQQLNEIQELLQDGLSNVWLSAAQNFQLQALFVDIRGSLFVHMPPFKPHNDDPDGNYGGGDDQHKDDADQDPFIFFSVQSDKDTVELAGKDQNATLTKFNNI